jgi:hypothetical protein
MSQNPTDQIPPETIYKAARSALLDALGALEPHHHAVVLAGAQAIYLRTAGVENTTTPFTTDGDLVIDPAQLGPEPLLAEAMVSASFELWQPRAGATEPGIWRRTVIIDGTEILIPVDLAWAVTPTPAAK